MSPRYLEPYEVVENIGLVAYRVALPTKFGDVRDIFHVSILRKSFGKQELQIVNLGEV